MSESDSELSVGRPSPIPPRDGSSQRKRHLSSVDEDVLICSTSSEINHSIIASMERTTHDAGGPISRHFDCLLCRNNVSVSKLMGTKKLCSSKINSEADLGPATLEIRSVNAAHISQRRTEIQRQKFETFSSSTQVMTKVPFVSPVRGTYHAGSINRPTLKSTKMKNPSVIQKEKSAKQGGNSSTKTTTSIYDKRSGFYLSPIAFGQQLSVGATFIRQIVSFLHFSFSNIHSVLNLSPESFTALDHNIQESMVRLKGINDLLKEVQEYLKVIIQIPVNSTVLVNPSSSFESRHYPDKSKLPNRSESPHFTLTPRSLENAANCETVFSLTEFNRFQPLMML